MDTSHEFWMAKAIQLAKQGERTTSPNPNVGCVIVKDGKLIGSGFHEKAGSAHAEVHALKEAGDAAQGATAYVTLEPCSHQGKTPPCADALIAAGVEKVICAMTDPNPLVAGQGLAKLQQAGIETEHGIMVSQAESLNPGFLKRMRTGLPFVTLKMASSLDGGTALSSGESQWITGPEARSDVQHGRAVSCAIVTGLGTVQADNPSLNVRLPNTQRQPARIILDTQANTPPDARIGQVGDSVYVVHGPEASPDKLAALTVNGFCCVELPVENGRIDIAAFMQWCGNQAYNRLWIEAGATLAGTFFEAGAVDEIRLYQAPMLLGANTRPVINTQLGTLKEVTAMKVDDVRFVGKDIRWTLVPDFA